MNKKTLSRKFLLGGAGAVALLAVAASGGYALTSGGDDDRAIPAADRQQAEDAAVAEAGGGKVTDSELDDEDSKYEVEVTLEDGNQVDVQLDENFDVVSTETDGPDDDGVNDDGDTDDGDTDDRALSAQEREQAERAALAETGGGTVTSTEADDLSGYEVEVMLTNGDEVDVQLDENFDVVTSRTDGPDDGNDSDDD